MVFNVRMGRYGAAEGSNGLLEISGELQDLACLVDCHADAARADCLLAHPVDAPVQGQLVSVLEFLHAHGAPTWFNCKFVEVSANVVLCIPFGVVALLAFMNKRWWQIGALGLVISGCMELGQLLFLHNRFASPLDLVTNAGGAVIGALRAAMCLKRLRAYRLLATGS